MRFKWLTIMLLAFAGLVAVSAPSLAQALRHPEMGRMQTLRSLQLARAIGKTPTPVAGTVGTAAHKGSARVLSADGGSISGHVTGIASDAYTMADIWVISTDSSNMTPDASGNINSFVVSTSLNADGTYKISGIPAGDYWVLAAIYGYKPQFFDHADDFEKATVVTVTDDAGRENVDFTMEECPVGGGSITGRVVSDVDGSAVAGADIYVLSLDNPFLGGWSQTDADGNYAVSGLIDGSYYVQVYADGFYPEVYDDVNGTDQATQVTVTEPNATSGIDFSLARAATISGRVVDSNGNPIAGVLVCAGDPSAMGPGGVGGNPGDSILFPNDDPNGYGKGCDGFGLCVITDENGQYTISGLADGDYTVMAMVANGWVQLVEWYDNATDPNDATLVSVSNGETVTGIDFVFDMPTVDGVIAGTVTDSNGNPVVGAFISVSMAATASGYSPFGTFAETGADGSYRIEGLPDGDYTVSAFAQNGWQFAQLWWPTSQTPDGAGIVSVASGVSDPTAVDFVLSLQGGSASISGTVLLDDGSPAVGAWVEIISLDPTANGLMLKNNVMTDDNGHYELGGLPAGSYLAYAVYGQDMLFADQWFENAATPDAATQIELADGGSRDDVNFTLTLRSYFGTISGVVTDDVTGNPVAGAYVEIAPSSWREKMGGFMEPMSLSAVTDASGMYSIEMVPEGEYIVSVYAHGVYELYENASTFESATPVTVTGGNTTTVNFGITARAEGSGSIAGAVTSQGSAIESAVVIAMPTLGNDADFFTGLTGSDGSYTITGMPEGEYYVMSFAPGYIGELYDDAYDPSTATLVTVGASQTGGVDFDLQPDGCIVTDDGKGGIISGKVTDRSGRAISGATVYLTDATGSVFGSARSGADGYYSLANVPPSGNYHAYATNPGYRTQYNDNAGSLSESAPLTVGTGVRTVDFALVKGTSGVADRPTTGGSAIELHGNYPNPFNGSTEISFSLGTSMHVQVSVFDALGREVASIFNGDLSAGAHNLSWNGLDAAGTAVGNGVYYYRVQNSVAQAAGAMMLAR